MTAAKFFGKANGEAAVCLNDAAGLLRKKVMNKKFQATLVVLVVLVGIILGVRKANVWLNPPQQRASDAAKIKGNPQAAIKIVEYTDFQCPACGHAEKDMATLWKNHEGALFLEYRPFPLTARHQNAFRAAMYAECAARQNKFWPFHDLLFEQQSLWGEKTDAEGDFKAAAAQTGLNLEELAVCLKDPSTTKAVVKGQDQGDNKGVRATPTFFVNGEMVVGGKKLMEKLNGLLTK